MRVLIPTYPRDAHAMEIALALEARGHLLLAPFVDFLLSRDPDFRWNGSPEPIRHGGYYRRAVERVQATAPAHVPPGDAFISREEEEG